MRYYRARPTRAAFMEKIAYLIQFSLIYYYLLLLYYYYFFFANNTRGYFTSTFILSDIQKNAHKYDLFDNCFRR